MTPIINPIWFYLMNVCENLVEWFAIISVVMGFIAIGLALIIFLYTSNDNNSTESELFKWCTKHLKRVTAILGVCIIFSTVIPTEDTLIKMFIAKTVTYENVEDAKQEAVDLVDYIIEKVNELMNNEEERENQIAEVN